MRRALVVLGLLACAYFEFAVYPGHTYLAGESQVFAPMLERLRFPGLLSRDLAATHPILRYTVYDEVTLLLERFAHLDLARALALQQFAARLSSLVGIFLLASSAALPPAAAFVIAVITGIGVALPGVGVFTSDREPLPYAIALGLAMLSVGLAAKGKVLLSGVAAGVALLYSPAVALPVWLYLLIPPLFARPLRRALRPGFTIFAVFALLLANLAQLQPGVPGSDALFSRASPAWLHLVGARTPKALVGTWASHEIWLYFAIATAGLCAAYRLWPRLNRVTRRLLCASIAAGLFSIPFTWIFQRISPLVFWMRFEPARALLLAVLVCFVLCGMAAAVAFERRLWREMALWSTAFGALLLTPFLMRPPASHDRSGAAFSQSSISRLSGWALHNTWGGSMFLFAGVGRHSDAGRFRALSLRPVYVDWQSGELTRYFADFAVEWSTRWQQVSAAADTPAQIRHLLAEPIDYYVTAQDEKLTGVTPVYSDRELAVYDARDLRNTRKWIRRAN